MKAAWALCAFASLLPAQRWTEASVRTPAGLLALDQATKDANADALVLLVASHPDDRYVLPAVWLRRTYGLRVAILLATRGGGGQNSTGSETGDALERIRTLETEVGGAQIGAEVWYLDRPDGGFRRSAAETFAEWGREGTLHDLARMLRRVRPDAVLTTHHAEEQHGHDLALVELLPEALALAADATFAPELVPHRVDVFLTGGRSTSTERTLAIDVERLDRGAGVTFRRHAYEILRGAHLSSGPPAPMAEVFEPVMRFEPQSTATLVLDAARPLGLPSVFDEGRWPGDPTRAQAIAGTLGDLATRTPLAAAAFADVVGLVTELRTLRAQSAQPDSTRRLERRLEALERLLLLLAGVQIEIDVPPGTIAVGGEEFVALVRVHGAAARRARWSIEGLGGVETTLQLENEGPAIDETDSERASIAIRAPRAQLVDGDPMVARFLTERFVPPIRVRFRIRFDGLEVPLTVSLPVEQRSPVELQVVPRMLLLPSARRNLQFSVGIHRNSGFPVEGELEVRGAAGYAIARDRVKVALRDQRSDTFGFDVTAPLDRKAGVDVLRIRMGGNRIELPIHKIDVKTPPGLRVGLVRSRDDTLPGVLGAGGLGVDWSELSDADVAVADLTGLDSIVVDIRALRDRPAVRSGFRRLLDFADGKGHRLVVLYQKDVEFQPPREGFFGAPHLPFQVGKSRVTRADAPVHVLLPRHVLLTHPNVIEPGDWDGWEQERALYLPSVWAGQYEELVEIHDPGQPPERGALLYAPTKAGEYVYCALSLWRQLKKLHPGAVRLMANLLTPSARS